MKIVATLNQGELLTSIDIAAENLILNSIKKIKILSEESEPQRPETHTGL